MELEGKHILSTKQFDPESLTALFELTTKMEVILEKGESDILSDKILAVLFFEPSTRTRFSFESAMQRLGGKVISNAQMMETSSIQKLESLEDTGKVISQMVDVVVMRHPESGSVTKLSQKSKVPVINAGDGSSEHPTQGLLDLYTIWKEKGGLDGLTVGIIGDLKYGRVPHSQCDLLRHFDVKFVFVSPEELALPREIIDELRSRHREIRVSENLEGTIPDMDVISMTRIQKERFESEKEYEKYAGMYILDEKLMAKAKEDAIVIHPLPRVDEIDVEVDKDKRAKYFEQVKNGVAIRMALLSMVLGVEI
ncbi:aspartate carbamoyltransferase [Candidatus Peregrinibacteria bacterium]|nr:aspartate carbamoyltransferase [Candidatus Peregrinibacteria bacterium]